MSVLSLLSTLEELDINIKLENSQLKINAPKGILNSALVNELKNKKREIIEFLQKKDSKKVKYSSIEPAEKKEYYELSSAQKRLYFFQQMSLERTVYNNPEAFELNEPPDIKRLEKTFMKLIKRHEALRTSFEMVADRPVQWVHSDVAFKIEYYDLAVYHKRTKHRYKIRHSDFIVQVSFVRPFDLNQVPLFRVGIIKSNERHILIVDMHHIISDGVSQRILVRDFMTLYAGERLPAFRLRYKDYSQWLHTRRREGVLKLQEKYWLKELGGAIPVLNMPYDYSRPSIQNFKGDSLRFELNEEETRALNQMAGAQMATLYMVLLSLYNIFLSKISRQEDIVVGTPIAGRNHADLEKIIGMFVNTLALRSYPSGKKPYTIFLNEVKKRTLEAFENQDYQFEDLVEKASLARDISRNPLFDVMFDYHNMMNASNVTVTAEQVTNGLKINPYTYKSKTSKFDLSLTAIEQRDRLAFSFEYCTGLFREETVLRFVQYFKKIISSVIEYPEKMILDIKIISDEEKKKILYDFNDTETEYPKEKTIHALFEQQVERNPDGTALVREIPNPAARESDKEQSLGKDLYVFDVGHLSYQKLNEKANRLAHLLRGKGIQPDTLVGIMVESSIDMLVGVLGVLKASAAYLPINPKTPTARVLAILKDSDAPILLTDSQSLTNHSITALQDQNIFLLDAANGILSRESKDNPENINQPGNLAYAIFTSGTTGKPKGVIVQHRNVNTYLHAFFHQFDITPADTAVQLSSFTFDIFVEEVFSFLLKGGKIVIPNEFERLDFDVLPRLITRHNVNVINCTPLLLNEFNRLVSRNPGNNPLKNVHTFISGGDRLKDKYIDNLLKIGVVYNTYGPTETTVCATYHKCSKENLSNVPIGKPIAGYRVYIMDKYQQLLPIGAVGELCISGAGITRGYLNHPELTKENYINISFGRSSGEPLERIYKTGDLARWLLDGNIQILGRLDHQVKIRGYRIELGEIENRLLNHPRVKEAIALVRGDESEDKYLCGYIVRDGELPTTELQEYLSLELPSYMIPSYFVPLDSLPLTPNGKIDRRALPKPKLKVEESYIPPGDEIESKLAALWSDELHIEKNVISIDSSFFTLGGHSLNATSLVSKIHKEFGVRVPLVEIFKAPQIQALARYIKGKSKDIYMSVKSVEKKEYYPLSPAQKRLYILQQMQLDGTAYNMPAFIPLEMDTDLTKIECAFKKLIARHENFHTSFYIVNDEPVQRVHDEVEFEIKYFDLATGGTRGLAPLSEDSHLSSVIRHRNMSSEFIRPFDLSQAPLLRVGVTMRQQEKYLLMVDMHHIISDGVSHGVLIKDFLALYEGEELPPLRIQYKDFSQWQNGEKEKEKIKQQESYWLKEFKGEIPVLELPIDYPRPKEQSFEGNRVNFEITGEETRGLKTVALKESSTLFMVLTAVFNILLSKLSGQEDIVIGTPIAGRRHADLEKIIGMFVNTLALRNYPSGERKFREFLEDVKEKTIKTFENQEYQFEELVDKLSVKRDIGRNPLFDVMLVLQNLDIVPAGQDEETEIENSRLNKHDSPGEYENIFQTTKFDLTFTAVERNRGLFFSIQYCTKLFKKETVERYIIYFKKIISIAANEPGIRISDIEIISEAEKNRLLYEFNDTEADYPKDKTIHRLFEEQAVRTPDSIALHGCMTACMHGEDGSLTYKELNEKSYHLAYMLLDKGVRQETAVGIMAERSVEIIIGILGILKTGGAYLPIDPDFPGERIKYMLNDSNAKALLTTRSFAEENEKVKSWNGETILLEAAAAAPPPSTLTSTSTCQVSPANLAYVIYTSGTTGKPKGVAINQKNLVNYVNWFTKKFEITGEDKTILTSSLSFDLGYTVLYTSLLKGGALHILQRETYLSAERLLSYIKEKGITYIKMTPSLFSVMVNSPVFLESNCKPLRLAAVGGEPINLKDIERAHSICKYLRIINHYGPTEATIGCVARIVDFNRFEEYKMNPTIGKPISNTGAYIFDKNLNLLPVSVSGELCISGAGIGSGYLNNPELTAERFLHVFHRSYKSYMSYIYRTGDLARWMPDGNIQFLGRIDTQVKIRGYRIELGEIENQLLTHHEIKETAVLLRENQKGDEYICAYIAARHSILLQELREYSSKRLPGYMVPSYFIFLDRIPLTANGKIDRNALPGPEAGEAAEEFQPPGNETEEKLAVIWADVLGIEKEKIGVQQNFFQIGGNSLSLVAMVSKIYKEFGREIPFTEIYHKPLISEISKLMFAKNFEEDPVVLLNKANTKKIFCFPPQIGYGIFYLPLAGIFNDYSFYAFSFIEDLEPETRLKKYVDIITDLQPVGPYILYGYSAASGLTFQVAKALENHGRNVSDIIFFDCFFTGNSPREVVREKSGEIYQFIDQLLEELQLTSLKEKVSEKTFKFMKYYRNITNLDKIDANVHLLLSAEARNNQDVDRNCWKHLTSKNCMIYNGFGRHREMFSGDYLEKNAEILRGILDNIESRTSWDLPDIQKSRLNPGGNE